MHYLLFYFIIFGIAGWIVDTFYRSIETKKYDPQSFIPFFSITYGLGGILLLVIFTYTQLPLIMHVLVGGLGVTLVELTAGIFCVTVLKKRYWDYSRNRLNYYGHIDALHTLYWLILSAAIHALLPYLRFH